MKDPEYCLKLTRLAVMLNTNCGVVITYREEDLKKLHKVHGFNKEESECCINQLVTEGFMYINNGKISLYKK